MINDYISENNVFYTNNFSMKISLNTVENI